MPKRLLILIALLTFAACSATPSDIPTIPQPTAGQF